MENGLQKLLGAKMFRAALPKSIFRVLIAFVAFWGLGALFQNCSQGFETSPYEMMSTMEKQVEEHSIQTKKLSTTFDLQLSDRNYVAGVLEDVFGPSAKTKLTEMVYSKPDEFGGPCSEYAHYKYKRGTAYLDKDPNLVCNINRSIKPLVAPAQAVRQGWLIQACAALVGTSGDTTSELNYALGKIKYGSSDSNLPEPNDANLLSLHKLFYRERPLPPRSVLDALRVLFQEERPTKEEWRSAIYSYCISSQWQVL